MAGRVLIVSNRLPVTVYPDKAPPDDVEPSSGGLVSALKGIDKEREIVWVGWPGNYCSSEDEQKRMTQRLNDTSTSIKMHPVWLSKDDVEDFYNGFSNATLWPLLHWMTPYAKFRKSWQESYKRVNQKFAEAVLSVAQPTDVVWVHDYHLFLMPQLLRKLIAAKLAEDLPQPGQPSRPTDLPPEEDGRLQRFISSDLTPLARFHSSDTLGGSSEALSNSQLVELPLRQPQLPMPAAPPTNSMFSAVSFADQNDIMSSCVDGSVMVSTASCTDDNEAVADEAVWPSTIAEVAEGDDTAKSARLSLKDVRHVSFSTNGERSVGVKSEWLALESLKGMLGADLVGFHTYNYLRHYRSCVIRLCGFTPEMDMVEHMGRRTRLGVFPIGANCADIQENMKSEQFKEHLKQYTNDLQGKSMVLSVERLDYTKGMPQKLAAIEQYLEEAHAQKKAKALEKKLAKQEGTEGSLPRAPTGIDERDPRIQALAKRFEDRMMDRKTNNRSAFKTSISQMWNKADKLFQKKEDKDMLDHSKTVFVFVAVPSRQTVALYKSIEEEVHKSISVINGRFGTVNEMPIHYIHRSISGDELAALYARADCCLVTPLVDGMNLVAKEYVAAKDDKVENVRPGTLVLSEFAGACQELFDALVVNPYDIDAVADAIKLGLEFVQGDGLDISWRWELTSRMRTAIIENDAVVWAKRFLEDLSIDSEIGLRPPLSRTTTPMLKMFARSFDNEKEGMKAIFLNFDGCFRAREVGTKDKNSDLPKEVIEMLQALNLRADLLICIVSGHTKELMDQVFLPYAAFVCIAEHGVVVRRPQPQGSWQPLVRDDSHSWMRKVQPMMELCHRCTPHSRLDIRASSITWHYDKCDEDYGNFKTKELVHQLALSTGNLPCEVLQGNKVVEIKSLHVKNSFAVTTVLAEMEQVHGKIDTILIVSDATTDDTMFAQITDHNPKTARVGLGETDATHRFDNWLEVAEYLKEPETEGLEQPPQLGRERSLRGSEQGTQAQPPDIKHSESSGSVMTDGFEMNSRFQSCVLLELDRPDSADSEAAFAGIGLNEGTP